jgi:hypothetical protein
MAPGGQWAARMPQGIRRRGFEQRQDILDEGIGIGWQLIRNRPQVVNGSKRRDRSGQSRRWFP